MLNSVKMVIKLARTHRLPQSQLNRPVTSPRNNSPPLYRSLPTMPLTFQTACPSPLNLNLPIANLTTSLRWVSCQTLLKKLLSCRPLKALLVLSVEQLVFNLKTNLMTNTLQSAQPSPTHGTVLRILACTATGPLTVSPTLIKYSKIMLSLACGPKDARSKSIMLILRASSAPTTPRTLLLRPSCSLMAHLQAIAVTHTLLRLPLPTLLVTRTTSMSIQFNSSLRLVRPSAKILFAAPRAIPYP